MYTERTVDGMGKYCTKKRDQLCHPERNAARRVVEGSRQGFTLMELMVYIAIVGIVVIVAGQAFSNSTKMRVRTQSMLKASEVAENVAALMKDDIAQMGAKSAMEAGTTDNGNNFGDVYTSVYMDPEPGSSSSADYSSFRVSASSDQSDLTIRRLRYGADGHYQAVEEVRWYVENGKLMRSCKLVEKNSGLTVAADDPCGDVNAAAKEVEMAEGVETFEVIPARPGALGDDIQVFPAVGESEFRLVPRNDDTHVLLTVYNEGVAVNRGGTSQTLTGFHSNYNTSTQAVVAESERKVNEVIVVKNETLSEVSWQSLCARDGSHFTFEAGVEYEISFEIPYPGSSSDKSMMFVPGVDHMSVGLRNVETGDLPKVNNVVQLNDFMFFPPLDDKGGGMRSMRFTVPHTLENVCLAFTFACFSPLVAQGKVTITKLKVSKVPSSSYNFDGFESETHKTDKQNVKAFKIVLDVKRNGESGHVEMIVPTPSNGPTD